MILFLCLKVRLDTETENACCMLDSASYMPSYQGGETSCDIAPLCIL